MTEMEEGHFAGGRRVLDAGRQLASERALQCQFREYVILAQSHAPSGRWLDIGCGSGTLLMLAQEAGYEVQGIELTPSRREVARAVTGAVIHAHPVEDIRFSDDHFDVITLINVFSHLTSPRLTLTELQRVLKPGGVIVMATGEVDEGIKKSHMFRWNLGDHLFFLGVGTIGAYASSAGLQLMERHRRWIPAETFTRERFAVMGGSRSRNAVKLLALKVPGVLPILRRVMLRLQSDNRAFACIFVLRKRRR